MKSKIFVVIITLFILLPVLYLASNELKYRAKHGNEPTPVNNTLDTTRSSKSDSVKM